MTDKEEQKFLRVFKPASMIIESAPTIRQEPQKVETRQQIVQNNLDQALTVPDIEERDTPEVEAQNPIPQTPTVTLNEEQRSKKTKAMLKRLQSHNSDWLKEGIIAPEDGGRPRRRQLET